MSLATRAALGQPAPSPTLAVEAQIMKGLQACVDELRQAVGVVLGIVGPDGRWIFSYGRLDRESGRPVDGNTIFEIGSLTKVFTSLVLADMVRRGEIALADPVSDHLPPNANVPEYKGRRIALLYLATHTSGLPRMPGNMHPRDPSNPYADYSTPDLLRFLADYRLDREIGSRYEYSNLGAGLLGLALARRAGLSYEELIEKGICRPLGMTSTGTTLSERQRLRLAAGHDALLAPMPSWSFDSLAGAGAVKSSANDLLTLLSLHLGLIESPLRVAATAMLESRRPTPMPEASVGLAWHILRRSGKEIVVHDGGTFGFRSIAGFNLDRRVGVVVLANAFTFSGCNDIAIQLLEMSPEGSPETASR